VVGRAQSIEDWLDQGATFTGGGVTFLLLIPLVESVTGSSCFHLLLLISLVEDVVGLRRQRLGLLILLIPNGTAPPRPIDSG
jgi:uncharacterized membrane protein